MSSCGDRSGGSSGGAYALLRASKASELAGLAEVQSDEQFAGILRDPASGSLVPSGQSLEESGMSREQVRTVLKLGMATQLLHREARVASFLGKGFYTIGPCGEELLGAVGLHLSATDPVALHYRHIATQMVRQYQHLTSLGQADEEVLEALLLDRSRAYTCSALDPVSHGMHCLIGGGAFDYPITSTLASQAGPAMGRALGGQLIQGLRKMAFAGAPALEAAWPSSFVSFVSLGDGSVNNAHFLSAANMAEYARFRGFKCPLVFAVSDNDVCISLRGYGWLQKEFTKKMRMPVFVADGSDLYDVYRVSGQAISDARQRRVPVMLVFANVPRRFGHAATDRQDAYFSPEEIARHRARNPLLNACATAVRDGATTFGDLSATYQRLSQAMLRAFDTASGEPKNDSVGRAALLANCAAPLTAPLGRPVSHEAESPRPFVMRQFMTSVIDELLSAQPKMVYIGEDVEHGGYYLVTAGLAKKHPQRVRDFPPDETALMAVGIGFAQAGLVPVVEIPYAKYLDCGADMFFEAAIMRWLTGGSHPTGMVIRLQGFDRGVFGGNFHTHNMLHMPPGVDVFCFSNGPDYARGFRTAFEMASQGRIVMLVDSTNLLNLRNLHDNADGLWSFKVKQTEHAFEPDDVIVYPPSQDSGLPNGYSTTQLHPQGPPPVAIVTYGNGVVTALQARKTLVDANPEFKDRITIVDTPCLSQVPRHLTNCLGGYQHVLFADVCKQGQNPFGNFITSLQSSKSLPPHWQCVAACPTYNPLGSVITFLNVEDIIDGIHKVLRS
ncbi:MAG: thiamine pyrophosphate-dependent enzyme [archaeon]|nr:thiamine pyrophosphate-dependent enzyme [archaeon]